MVKYVAYTRDYERCTKCGWCEDIILCPSSSIGSVDKCYGCGACYSACPNEAIYPIEVERIEEVKIRVDGEVHFVPKGITVKKALEHLGFKVSKFPGEGDICAPCETGGCYSCVVLINGALRPACITPVEEGMEVGLRDVDKHYPLRIVHGWMGHPVGGVGTPWYLKGVRYVEAAVFAAGCNLRCPQCQNWTTTYCSKDRPLDPKSAAVIMTYTRRKYGVDRMAISGGECTLNRGWLIEYIRELKKLNPDEKARFHVDTNATVLTRDYIDELVEAGMTDIGIDIKAYRPGTFARITGVGDRRLIERYMRNAWEAFKYTVDSYKGKVFVGIGIPYNRKLISIEEVVKIGDEICKVDPDVQVCVLDYRAEFRRMDIGRPSFREMVEVWKALKGCGLRTVICQTELGHIGPYEPKPIW